MKIQPRIKLNYSIVVIILKAVCMEFDWYTVLYQDLEKRGNQNVEEIY